ncbi:hypothetical protein AVEN_115490-1 [Araneus ventricosus]|uniref:Uncharacterized protein n=1 Tax=Araneus ventricosus TaxID=182803 RepID=A0A4Y2SXZ5_ARAVE|nr:hypothetical protein AVEN_115490-1 [Araneus ventricosus]
MYLIAKDYACPTYGEKWSLLKGMNFIWCCRMFGLNDLHVRGLCEREVGLNVFATEVFLKSVMSSRGVHLAAEFQAGLHDLRFLNGSKNGPETDVIDFCMKMDLTAKEYISPIVQHIVKNWS